MQKLYIFTFITNYFTLLHTLILLYFCNHNNSNLLFNQKNMEPRKTIIIVLLLLSIMGSDNLKAQRTMSLQECRELALENNNELKIAREKMIMADNEKKAAFSNYLPKLSATGIYMYNSKSFALISDSQYDALSNIGSNINGNLQNYILQIIQDPYLLNIISNSTAIQNILGMMQGANLGAALDAIGTEIANSLTPDTQNIYGGMISLQEPIYVGGKIRAYNKIALYSKQLAQSQYDTEQNEIIVTTDQAYWQIVSLSNKCKLAENYVNLLKDIVSDVDKMVEEGVATTADKLNVKVKLNDAELTLLKVRNGLMLSKMLLCQHCGLPIDSDILLETQSIDDIIISNDSLEYTEEEIFEKRPELTSLLLATKIYDKKVNIIRSDFLPTVSLAGNYIISNPSCFNGFENEFSGFWNIGVIAKIPLFHWGEGLYKIRKAESEARIAKIQLEDSKEMIMLQVRQYEKQIEEAQSRIIACSDKLSDAEENMRIADLGFKEGVMTASEVTEAQTSWLNVQSELIDAKIDYIMATTYLRKATGTLK